MHLYIELLSQVSDVCVEKEMAPHSSVLAWRIPGMEEPGGLPSMGSHRVGHDWSDAAAPAEMYVKKKSWTRDHQASVTLSECVFTQPSG